jgi:hemoglobin-like flavoprotein
MGGIITNLMVNKEEEALKLHIGMSHREIDIVVSSWADIKKFGAEEAGVILFKRFFTVQPATFMMFAAFKDEKNWETSKEFKHHCKIVMNIIGSAVGLLKDPDSLDSTLEYLGMKHDDFGITSEHFDIMGRELIETYREILGPKLTPEVTDAWLKFYKYTVKMILEGMKTMEPHRAQNKDA